MNLRECLGNKGIDIAKLLLPNFEQMASYVSEARTENPNLSQATLYIHEQYGRFGNNIYQILHALVIARYLGLKLIDCKFNLESLRNKSFIIEDIILSFGIDQPPEPPNICATAFYPYGFEICFHSMNYAKIKSDAEKLGRFFFKDHPKQLTCSTKNIAVHFRSGDIFSDTGTVHHLYVQPPLSYYVLALDHICETQNDFTVYIIFENENNPTIRSFIDIVKARNIPYVLQSSSLEEDAFLVSTAHCIVSSFSTFCEALAMMNENIRRWYAFRTVTAHGESMEPFLPYKFCEIMQSDNVDVFVIEDQSGQYITPKTWNSSADQIAKMQTYPISNLKLRAIPNVNRGT